MKKLLSLTMLILLFTGNFALADVTFFSENNKFGAKDTDGNVIIEPTYQKLVRLGDHSFIARKKNKYGIINDCDEILVPIKYRHSERVLGKYVKLGNYQDYALYDGEGFAVIPPIYDSIDLLFGGMLLTYKNYKYGVSDFKGNVLLDNKFDDIYMPKSNIMHLQYEGKWYEIEQVTSDTLTLPQDIKTVKENSDFKVSNIMVNTGVASGYSVLTFSDYIIKLISSISPAHEETIDELMFSQGAESVSVILKCAWIPIYPFAFARNYYRYIRNPNNGPLSGLRNRLKQKFK